MGIVGSARSARCAGERDAAAYLAGIMTGPLLGTPSVVGRSKAGRPRRSRRAANSGKLPCEAEVGRPIERAAVRILVAQVKLHAPAGAGPGPIRCPVELVIAAPLVDEPRRPRGIRVYFLRLPGELVAIDACGCHLD